MTKDTEFNVPKDGRSNFNWALLGELLISFGMPGQISQERFKEFLDTISNRKPLYLLAVSTGASTINSVQRKTGAEVVKVSGIKIAVVLDNAITRGLITALGWLGLPMKSCANEIQALEYLAPQGIEPSKVLEIVAKLKAQTFPADK